MLPSAAADRARASSGLTRVEGEAPRGGGEMRHPLILWRGSGRHPPRGISKGAEEESPVVGSLRLPPPQ